MNYLRKDMSEARLELKGEAGAIYGKDDLTRRSLQSEALESFGPELCYTPSAALTRIKSEHSLYSATAPLSSKTTSLSSATVSSYSATLGCRTLSLHSETMWWARAVVWDLH